MDIWECLGDAFGAFDEFEGAAAVGLETCGDGEDERVDEEVGFLEISDFEILVFWLELFPLVELVNPCQSSTADHHP